MISGIEFVVWSVIVGVISYWAGYWAGCHDERDDWKSRQ